MCPHLIIPLGRRLKCRFRPRSAASAQGLAAGWLAAAAVIGAASGCEEAGVRSWEVAKGVERVPGAEGAEAGGSGAGAKATGESATGASALDHRLWKVPDGWVEEPEPRPMRVATYVAPDRVGGVEVAVTRFAGRVGGELANVNRWRGQMGLGPIGEGELSGAIARFTAPGFEGYGARIESPAGVMLAAGVYEAGIDQTWFVRATAPDGASADRLWPGVFGVARSIAGVDEQ